MRYNVDTNAQEVGMKNKKTKIEKVEKAELLQELMAMLDVCFEGKAIVYDGALRMTLPNGQSFQLAVEEVS